MSEENKYEKLPENMLPQVKSQCEERIKALEKVVETQTATLAAALEGEQPT